MRNLCLLINAIRFLLIAFSLSSSSWAYAGQVSLDKLSAKLAEFESITGGVLGVGVVSLSTGESTYVNGDVRFPMASTYKIAIAATILQKIDSGELGRSLMVDIPPSMYVGSSVITDFMPHPGLSMSVLNLIELMMIESDNTATDILVDLAGGPNAITKWLRSVGISGQRIDRDTASLLQDFYGIPSGRPFLDQVKRAEASNPDLWNKVGALNPSYDDDPRDTSTPMAMADLLFNLFQGNYLSSESTRTLIAVMERCRTGADRIKGLLPPGTPVAHKTGTLGATSNDVGAITLPDGQKIVIVVFVKKSDKAVEHRARAIAEVARTTHDYFWLLSH